MGCRPWCHDQSIFGPKGDMRLVTNAELVQVVRIDNLEEGPLDLQVADLRGAIEIQLYNATV
jgi:hypothetical protein